MPKTQKDIEKYLINLYDSIIKNGKTHDEALQEVSDYCYEMANYKRGLLYEKQFNYPEFSQVVTNLSKKEYANSLITIIERWTKQAEKALNPTNNSCKNIITLFANQILSSMDNKIVFDPAIGCGYLLLDLNTEIIIGQDINIRLAKFAENILSLKGFNINI